MNVDNAVTGGNGVDKDGFDPIYDGFAEAPLMDAKDPEDALPAGLYVVKFDGFKGVFTKDENLPQIRGSATIVDGVEGTVGRKAFGALKYGVSKFEYRAPEPGAEKVKMEMTPAERLEKGKDLQLVLKRVAKTLELDQELPTRPHTTESLSDFGSQFASKTAVIRIGTLPGQRGFEPSNFFDWATIRQLTEQVVDKKGVAQGTALDVARRKIAAANNRAAAKSGKTATAAAAVNAPAANPTDFS